MERWHTKCPHCGEYHNVVHTDIRFEHETSVVEGEKTYKITSIWYVCPGCGAVSTESEMKKQPSKWVAANPDAYEQGVRSFWLNAFCSPWATWESIMLEYLKAIGNTQELQVVYNTRFGELWEDRGDTVSDDDMLSRREEYTAELPDGVLVVTAGVDTQDDRFEYELVGHGHFGETWGIEAGVVLGRPDDPEVWARLDELVFDRVLHFGNGVGLRVSISFVDEQGHFAQEVRQRCNARLNRKVFAIAGSHNHDAPFTSPARKQKITVPRGGERVVIGQCWRYDIGVDAGKQIIMDNLRVQTPGPRYCHFPRRDDYGPAYFVGLLSERLNYNESKKQPWEWKKIPGHERNERLDCRNYANAAFKVLPKDLDKIDRELKEAKPGAQAQKTAPVPAAQRESAKPKRERGAALDKYYDSW